MDHWNGAQGLVKVAKKTQKHPHLWRSPQRTPNPNWKKFFSISTTRLAESVEGLNSSLAQLVGELQRCKTLQKSGAGKTWEAEVYCIVDAQETKSSKQFF